MNRPVNYYVKCTGYDYGDGLVGGCGAEYLLRLATVSEALDAPFGLENGDVVWVVTVNRDEKRQFVSQEDPEVGDQFGLAQCESCGVCGFTVIER